MIKQRRLLHAVVCLRQWYGFSNVKQILVIHTLVGMVWHGDDFMGNRDSLPMACVWFFLSLSYINIYMYNGKRKNHTHAFTSSVSNYIYSSQVYKNLHIYQLLLSNRLQALYGTLMITKRPKLYVTNVSQCFIFHFKRFLCCFFFGGGVFFMQICLILRIDE